MGQGAKAAREVARREGLDGSVHRIPQLAIGIDEQERQELVPVLHVPVDRRGHDAEVAGHRAEREGGGSVQGEMLAAQPDDLLDGPDAGLFAGRPGLGGFGHSPRMA